MDKSKTDKLRRLASKRQIVRAKGASDLGVPPSLSPASGAQWSPGKDRARSVFLPGLLRNRARFTQMIHGTLKQRVVDRID
jgi:hypothetical protein